MAYQPQEPQNQTNQPQNTVIGESALTPVYTDGVVRINIVGDVIRIDLCNIVAEEEGKYTPIITTKLAMSLGAFAKTAEIIEDFTKKLIQAGVIKKT